MSIASPVVSAAPQASAETIAALRSRIAVLERTAGVIGQNAVKGDHIDAASITTGHLQAGAITAELISAGAVTATAIAASTITGEKLQADTITSREIAASTITATEIAASTITGALIAASTITAANIASGTITGALIAGSTITGDKVVTGTLTADKLNVSNLAAVSANMGTLTAGKIVVGSTAKVQVGAGLSTSIVPSFTGLLGSDAAGNATFKVDVADGSVQMKGTILTGSSGLGNISGQINGTTNVVPASIGGDRLIADTITAREIAASTITAVQIAAATITAGKIATGTITATQIAAGTITGDKLTATAIDGKTITGAILRTSDTGARVVIDGSTDDLSVYDAGGTVRTRLDGPNGLSFFPSSASTITYVDSVGTTWTHPDQAGLAGRISVAEYRPTATSGSTRIRVRSDAPVFSGTPAGAHAMIQADRSPAGSTYTAYFAASVSSSSCEGSIIAQSATSTISELNVRAEPSGNKDVRARVNTVAATLLNSAGNGIWPQDGSHPDGKGPGVQCPVLRGFGPGNAAELKCESGNTIRFIWDGTRLQVRVDGGPVFNLF